MIGVCQAEFAWRAMFSVAASTALDPQEAKSFSLAHGRRDCVVAYSVGDEIVLRDGQIIVVIPAVMA